MRSVSRPLLACEKHPDPQRTFQEKIDSVKNEKTLMTGESHKRRLSKFLPEYLTSSLICRGIGMAHSSYVENPSEGTSDFHMVTLVTILLESGCGRA